MGSPSFLVLSFVSSIPYAKRMLTRYGKLSRNALNDPLTVRSMNLQLQMHLLGFPLIELLAWKEMHYATQLIRRFSLPTAENFLATTAASRTTTTPGRTAQTPYAATPGTTR
jgi:hypothetical protein